MFAQRALSFPLLLPVHHLLYSALNKANIMSILTPTVCHNLMLRFRHSQAKSGRGFGEPHIYLHKKDACMHSNTTSFVVNAFAPPHTIKVPIKGHYGFSTSSNRRKSSSTARTHCGRTDVSCVVIQRNSG